MAQFYWDVKQGTAEWYKLRSGIPTASEFHHIMTPAKRKPSESRKKYGVRLVLERLMKWQADSLDKIGHIADGKANEPLAVAKMELIFNIETKPVGFVKTNDGRFGASPDRAANLSPTGKVYTVVEVKCPTPQVQMERFLFPDEAYICQRQGQLLVAEADKAIFFSFNPRMPDYMVTDSRDEGFLRDLRDNLERFSDELEGWTEQARAWGPYQAFEDVLPPAEVEHATNLAAGLPADNGLMSDEELDSLIRRETLKWGG